MSGGARHECLTIHAEGIWDKKRNWVENLLKSVSVEFECIDKIYEANIKKGIITDASEDLSFLLRFLKGEKEIFIFGTGREEQDAYDFLVENDVDVCGFVGMNQDGATHKLFGKK